MPLTSVNYEEIVLLFEKVLRCVVSITQVTEEGNEAKQRSSAGTGFILYCSEEFTVVSVHNSFSFESQNAFVKFWDETETGKTELIKLKGHVNLIVVKIPRGDWDAIEYGEIEGSSDIVLSVVSLIKKLNPFVSRIISPRCTAVNSKGDEIVGSRETFTFNLPLAGKIGTQESKVSTEQSKHLKNQVLGAPVFDMNGKLVGFINQCGQTFDFKYGKRSSYFRAILDEWLAGRQWKDAIQSDLKKVEKSTQSSKRLKRELVI